MSASNAYYMPQIQHSIVIKDKTMEDVASSSSTTGRKRPKRDVEYDDNEAKDESAAIAAPTSNNKRARRGVSSSNSISSTTSSSGIRTQTMATRAVTTTAISSSIKPGSVRPAVTSGEDRSYDNGNTNKNEETELSLPLTFAMAVAANDSQQEDRILTFGSTGISAVNPTLTTDVIAATTTAAAIRSNKLGDTAKTRSTSSTTSATLTSSVWSTRLLAMTICLVFMTKQGVAFWTRTRGIRSFQHVIPPQHVLDDETILIGGRKETDENKREYQRVTEMYLSNMTLRSFLTNEEGFHLAMAVRSSPSLICSFVCINDLGEVILHQLCLHTVSYFKCSRLFLDFLVILEFWPRGMRDWLAMTALQQRCRS